MLREAELFATADDVLVEVLGRIRDDDRAILLPPLADLPGAEQPTPLGRVVELCAYDDACVPGILAGGDVPIDREGLEQELRGDVHAVVARLAAAAAAAATQVLDGDAIVPASSGELAARDYLLRLAVNRSLVAHYVAAYLGSTACPLPEELARPLWDLTAADAAAWRALGIFREPLPIPPLASWRDTFLRTAGHEPHPLGH